MAAQAMIPAADSKARGFTLIEVMIALFLIGIGLLAVAPLFVYAAKSTASSGDLSLVGARAVRRMETLRQASFGSLAAGGNLAANTAGYFDSSDPACAVRWTVTDNATPATRKTIIVRALAARRVVGLQKEVQLTTVRVK